MLLVLAVGACASGAGDGSGAEERTATSAAALPFVPETTSEVPSEPRADLAGFATGSALIGRSLEGVRSDLDGIAATGVRWLRADIDWSFVQRGGPSQWDWSRVDAVVREATARGLSVVGLLAYTPEWARPPGTSDKHPPVDPNRFAVFAAAAVMRYADVGVHHWEIWNEPNISDFWEPRPDAERYASLLATASEAVRSADAGAVVISGGLAPGNDVGDGSQVRDAEYLGRLYAAGVAASFDAVAVHPYSYPALPEDATDDFGVNGVRAVHALMKEHGDGGKEVWATEMGAPTGGAGAVSPEVQARTATEAFAAWARYRWAGPMLWFSYRDESPDPNGPQTFGLVSYDGVPKPALAAFEVAVDALG